ncbi:hypothetical protein HYC85_013518, partial [Camellia sinensis]
LFQGPFPSAHQAHLPVQKHGRSASPVSRSNGLTFARVIKKKSNEDFSCVPYIIALLNCFLYTWYGLPVVSYRWENFPVPVILVFCITAIISAFAFHDHHHRKIFVGSIGLVASIAMYGSPLVVVSPNLVGSPLGILQLVIYFKYRKRGIMGGPHKCDIEKNGDKTEQQLQVMVAEDTNGKI